MMTRRLAVLGLVALLAGAAFVGTRPKAGAPAELRLVDVVADAIEIPPAPSAAPARIFEHLPVPASDEHLAIPVPVEARRPTVFRLRLPGGAAAGTATIYGLSESAAAAFGTEAKGIRDLPAAHAAGSCVLGDAGSDGQVICQRLAETGKDESVALVVLDEPGRQASRLEVFDSAFEDARAPRTPALWPLVRRTSAAGDLGYRTRTSLLARPGGRWTFEVELPSDHATLLFATGHEPGERGAPMRFVVRDGARVLFDEVTPADRRFHDHRLALEGTRGSKVRLTFEASAAGDGLARGLWVDPRVVGDPKGPNVLLVTIDALRADHLTSYGYPLPTAPTIDLLARNGLRFQRATSNAGSTWESVTSLLTGRYPAHAGVRMRGQEPLPELTTLPDRLASRGYETFAGAWAADFPPAMLDGFDDVEVIATGRQAFPDERQSGEAMAVQLRELLQRRAGRPFMAWFHVDFPHYPLTPSEPARFDPGYTGRFSRGLTLEEHHALSPSELTTPEKRHLVALYDAAIADADQAIHQLIGELEKADVLDDTLIVVTADHGEAIGEHGLVLEHSLPFPEVLRVPLVMAWPNGITPRAPIETRVQLVDLATTILRLADAPVDGLDGRDLGPALRGEALADAPAFAEVRGVRARFDGDEEVVLAPGEKPTLFRYYDRLAVPVGPLHVFALDGKNPQDVAATDAARATAGRARVAADSRPWDAESAPQAPLGQDAIDALRQAGYFQDAHRTATLPTAQPPR